MLEIEFVNVDFWFLSEFGRLFATVIARCPGLTLFTCDRLDPFELKFTQADDGFTDCKCGASAGAGFAGGAGSFVTEHAKNLCVSS